MCDVLDKVENRGIEKGIVKGDQIGKHQLENERKDQKSLH